MAYTDTLKLMDVIVVYNPNSWLHRMIFRVTKYKAGHVALYVGDGMIMEAGKTGVFKKPCKSYSSNSKIYLARQTNITYDQMANIWLYCANVEGQKYAFGQLLMMIFNYTFLVPKVPDVSKKAMICSEFVTNAFMAAKIKLFDKPSWMVTPGDILKSDKMVIIECQ